MLQRYLAHLALETVPFFDVGQVLRFEVLRQVPGCIELMDDISFLQSSGQR
jgi:hypothetical protein